MTIWSGKGPQITDNYKVLPNTVAIASGLIKKPTKATGKVALQLRQKLKNNSSRVYRSKVTQTIEKDQQHNTKKTGVNLY